MKYVWPLALLLWVGFLTFGVGPLPPLGRLLDLHSGLWAHRPHGLTDQPVEGLQKSVFVAWDPLGVPHFFADNEEDLYRAQGFVMASQRLFQMDLSTRQTLGRLSEWVGDKTLAMDRFQIQFGMRDMIADTEKSYLSDPANRRMIESFVAGVNAYIGHMPSLPPEYTLLGVKPEPFTAQRVIAMDKLLTFSLSGRSFGTYLTTLQQKFGTAKVLDLFPEHLPKVFEDYIFPENSRELRRPEAPEDFPFTSHLKKIPAFPLPNPGKGSNNWAVAGSRSVTGHSLFANDTHLGYSLPNIWYESQLQCPEFNVYGVSLVAIPGIVNGLNSHVAWGPTNGTTSVLDWVEVEFENETSTRYKLKGQWVEAKVHLEHLVQRGAPTENISVVWTELGPVMHREGRYGLVANWMGRHQNQELKALRGLYTAKDSRECALSLKTFWSAPIQNFICADADHISIAHTGRVPERKIGEGRFVMDGQEGHDTLAEVILPSEALELVDPPSGIVLSANQKAEGPHSKHYLGWDYEEPFRALGIRRQLAAKDKLSAQDMMSIQNDIHDMAADFLLARMLRAINRQSLSAEQLAGLENLEKWNLKAQAANVETTLFKAWLSQFKKRLAEDAGVKDLRVAWLLDRLAKNPKDSDAQFLPAPVDISLRDAYQAAWQSLVERFGSKPEAWTWERYNAASLPHVARLPGWGSAILPLDGSGESVRGNHGKHGPTYKAVVELGDTPKAWMQVPGGNEGDPLNPDFGRFVTDWVKGDMHPVEFYKDLNEAKRRAVRVVELKAAGVK